jgi:hypothetical protein
MGKSSAKPTMMRFEPQSGWSDAGGQVISINDHLKLEDKPEDNPEDKLKIDSEPLSAEALVNLGESMQDVFDSLKINDPRLQAWTQVHAAIRLISGKIQEQNTLRARIEALDSEIEGVRSLASELVSNAYRGEQEVHETSKLRMQIAESLHDKLISTLKN